MKVVIYDRMDNDGRGSLAVFNRYANENSIEYVAYGLNRDMKTESEKHYMSMLISLLDERNYIDEVIFMDLAPRTLLEADVIFDILDQQAISMKVIDHHNLPYYMSDIDEDITYVYESGVSACMLVWRHYFAELKPPYVVELINDRDVWINALQPDTNYLYNTFDMMKQTELNDLIGGKYSLLDAWLAVGKIREESTIQPTIQGLVDSCKVIEWNGHKIVTNTKDIAPEYVSEVGNRACRKYECDFFASVYPKGNEWGYGLRSLNGEALKFIRDNGFKGGGHPNACGFSHEEKLF